MQDSSPKKKFYGTLYFRVIVGILLGVILGVVSPATAGKMEPLGKGFINLIRMMIGPVIFFTVVVGIASIGDMRKLGRVGLKALLYFEVVTSIALVIGLVVVNVIQPGVGMNVDAVLGNNVGFEPFRIFDQAHIEVYTDVQGTALSRVTLMSSPHMVHTP